MTETLSTCPVCRDHQFQVYLEGEDYFLTGEQFTIVSCKRCGSRFTNPRPDEASAGKYYHSDQYLSHDASKKGIIPLLYRFARNITVRSKYRVVKQFSSGPSLLDVGCGTGEFIRFCLTKGLRADGVEPSEKARNVAFRIHDLALKADLFRDLPPGSRFDCITLWHVLEHMYRLEETIRKLTSLLHPGGVLIVALPNCNSYDAHLYGKFWAAYDLPRHLYHFNRESFRTCIENHSLSLLKIIPQKLDAYYISMLSETYRTGSPRYFLSVYRGFRSNLAGRNPQTGYSSEIYILKMKNA